MAVGRNVPSTIQTYGKNLFQDSYKIRNLVNWKNLKLGVVIVWTISIVKKKFCCHSNMPGGF